MKKMEKLLLPLFLFVAVCANAQPPESFLENSVKLQTYPIILNDKVEFFNADIINVVLGVNLGDPYNDTQIAGTYILKDKNGTTLFENMEELYNSTEFREAFSAKVKTYEDAAPVSSFLCTLNNSLSFGYYFRIGRNWYFTTSDGNGFWGNEGFELSCSDAGTIENIAFQPDIKVEMPDDARRNESRIYTDMTDFSISEQEKEQVLQELKSKADFLFSTSPAYEYNLDKLQVLAGELTVSEKYDDVTSTSTYPFLIIKNGYEYIPVSEKDDLLENDLYIDAVKSEFTLKTDADAQDFRAFLDTLVDADPEVKSHKKIAENVWFFANRTSFGDTLGVLLLTDENGKIKAFSQNSADTKKDILRLKMQDPEFKMDYGFNLVEPQKTSVEASEEQNIYVSISFDEDPVNASGAWIATMANGKPLGMSASTDMKSPFTDEIPAGYLGKGTHTVEYLLMKPGDDYENPLSRVTLIIKIR